jgi:hypothetical protein
MKRIGLCSTACAVAMPSSALTSRPYSLGILPSGLPPAHTAETCSPVLPSGRIQVGEPGAGVAVVIGPSALDDRLGGI